MKKYTLAWLVLTLFTLTTCRYDDFQVDPSVGVAYFPDGKQASLAFTFDDNCLSSFTKIAPMLEEYGYKGTFFLIAGQVYSDASWSRWRGLSERGHEIGNHTMNHPDLSQIRDSLRLDHEINSSYDLIKKKIGKAPFSFAHPYHKANKLVNRILSQRHYASRIYPGGCCMWGITSSSTEQGFRDLLNTGIDNNYFMALAGHGIGDGWEPVTESWLRDCLEIIKERESEIAVDHFGNLAKYKIERENTQVKAKTFYKGVSFSLETSLDTAVFNYPLTVVIDNPGSKGGSITPLNGSKLLDITYRGNKFFLKALPGSSFLFRSL